MNLAMLRDHDSVKKEKIEKMGGFLTVNAIDFIDKAIREFQCRNIKYSTINFFSGIELFLKARLFADHWFLVVENVDKASLQSLQNGETTTVTFKGSTNRLSNILGKGMEDEIAIFDALRRERNKMVHFYHITNDSAKTKKKEQYIVSLQCRAWYHLHELLSKKWKPHFEGIVEDIEKLNLIMQDHSRYLNEKFNLLKQFITNEKNQGIVYSHCPVCQFDSLKGLGIIGNNGQGDLDTLKV